MALVLPPDESAALPYMSATLMYSFAGVGCATGSVISGCCCVKILANLRANF